MKFAEHLSAHITPEWRQAYINYEVGIEIKYVKKIMIQKRAMRAEKPQKRIVHQACFYLGLLFLYTHQFVMCLIIDFQ